MKLSMYLNDMLSVIYPRLCPVCGSTLAGGERTVCLQCFADMPRTDIHTSGFNEIHQRTAHHTRIERAEAYFHYERHSPYARLIHLAKYNNRPRIARELAESYASEIAPSGFFDGIDLIVPVPLHWLRLMSRGYNQSLHIAGGISAVTGIPVSEYLRVCRFQRSQTRRSATGRHTAATGLYRVVEPHAVDGKHILVVDDVITTGATMSACCHAIMTANTGVTLSLLALGLSRKV